ncbi:MAG: hypothetical protein OEM28_10535 [Nitrosopumilus sp.]|nr:hypothetical protein [Nitrosopumilus sp.]MDH3487698.1 hypothetical protein [Nitrosopumilus sp.]
MPDPLNMITMNKIILISILIGFVIIGSTSFILISENSSVSKILNPVYENDFTFYDVEKLEKSLAEENIFMSTPTAITDHTIDQYCTYFDSKNNQKTVEYCTTTALLNSDGETIGNLNMGGMPDDPILALAIIDASPLLNSKKDEVNSVFQTMIETLVCDCWEIRKPGGFESIKSWLDTAEEKYTESSQTTLKSEITGLDNKRLILEITSTDKSYLWTLIVLK